MEFKILGRKINIDISIKHILIQHRFIPRIIYVHERPVETERCGFETNSNLNSTCFGPDYCNAPIEDHIK